MRVYEEICTLARLNRGRVYPSYDRLAEVTGLGRATIARTLTTLEAAGFLVRQPVCPRGRRGGGATLRPDRRRYRSMLPQPILALLPRWMRPAQIPCDQAHRDAEQAAELAAMKPSLSARELAGVTVGGPLGRVLARLGAALDRKERESHTDPQPLRTSLDQAEAYGGLDGRQHPA